MNRSVYHRESLVFFSKGVLFTNQFSKADSLAALLSSFPALWQTAAGLSICDATSPPSSVSSESSQDLEALEGV